MEKDQRTGPRYFLNPPLPGLVSGNSARIVDIGAKGVRVELQQRLQAGAAVDVIFAACRIPGTVLWCQIDALNFSSNDDFYLAGIAFRTPLPEIEELGVSLAKRGEAIHIVEMRANDRYRITAPLTGSFGDIAPVSIVDLSITGARIALLENVRPGHAQRLRFQVDDQTGPVSVEATVVWCSPSPIMREFYAGLEIAAGEEVLRKAIHRLCTRDEARIDMDSLKRKFDALRLASRVAERPQSLAV